MLRVIYPIHLDRWQSPISSQLREVAVRNPQIDFYSFGEPISAEDQTSGSLLWSNSHIQQISLKNMLQERFDVVHHASATTKNLAAVLLSKARSLGQCTHLFTAVVQPHKQDAYYQQYVRSVHTADVVIAISHIVASDIKEQFGREVDAIIPNGVDLSFYSPDTARPIVLEKLGIQQPYVLFVGFLCWRKRPDIFMRIASLLPELDFVMVGGTYNSHERDKYLSSVLEKPNVKYLGQRSKAEVRDLMAGAIALVFPSEVEGLALTLLEATAMGLPILAQPKSSMPEVVLEGTNGWLLPGDQLEVWANKLKQILNWSEVDKNNFAKKAQAFVANNYSWDTVARQYAEVYIKAANSK